MDLQEVRCGGWTGSSWLRIDRWWAHVTVVMNREVILNAGNFFTSEEPVNFSRRALLHGVSK